MLLCLCDIPAQASFSREDYYALGLSALEEMKWQQAERAENCFDLAGTYLEAKNYKQYALTEKAYEGGRSAYRRGDYKKAAQVLEGLNWQAGEYLYHNAVLIPKSQQFDVSWNTYKENWDILLNGSMVSSDTAAMKESLDQAFAMEGMADEGKTIRQVCQRSFEGCPSCHPGTDRR